MLKSIAFVLALSGALLTTSVAVNAQLSQKENSSFSYSRDDVKKDWLCKYGHICK